MRDMQPQTRAKLFGPEYITRELEITGRVLNPLKLGCAELRTLQQQRIEGLTILCGSGKVKERVASYQGVLLRDLLDLAEVELTEHDTPNHTYVVASGSDGYFVLFSWHELFNSPLGDGVLVIIEKNDAPLNGDEGEIGLVSAGDQRPGPRHMRYLKRIEVCELPADRAPGQTM
ncbi:MAG: molybdopterin-dependent oxidoreductase [Geobacter sp.]|nr:molybdopterin-dependent oxidoreductase [Geobacter sp.]